MIRRDRDARHVLDLRFCGGRDEKPPISFVESVRPIEACKKCGTPEPKPRTRNQVRCNACCDVERWGKR